jgi:glucose uptake protein GlcU
MISSGLKWLIVICLLATALSMTGSAYSLGKNDKNKNTDLFKSAIAFLVIGSFFFVVTVAFLTWFTQCGANEMSFATVFGTSGAGAHHGSGGGHGNMNMRQRM